MKYWAMVLHFYQPPTQDLEITKNILEFCYLPLLRMLVQKSGFGLTFNITGSLLVQLQDLKADEFFSLVKQLIADKKVEIINSVVYHPLMPLTPASVLTRQITENEKLLKAMLGIETTHGFFPPELAVDKRTLDVIPGSYIFVDESSVNIKSPIVKYQDKLLLVNNRVICNLLRAYPAQLPSQMVSDLITKDVTITANDAELFGHHYVERLQVLTELLANSDIKFITASDLIAKVSAQAWSSVTEISPSTWQDCAQFALWQKNALQQEYLRLLEQNPMADQAFSSCYLYWLSNWPWWHPGLVEKGVSKMQPSDAVSQFLSHMWAYHTSGQVEENYRKFDTTQDKYLGI